MSPRLTPPPETVLVGPLLYKVVWDEQYLDANDIGGESDHNALTITLNPSMHPLNQKRIMVHEILHCCFFAGSLNIEQLLEPVMRTEEALICVLTTPIFGVLRDNPKLLKWVTA